MDGLDGPLTVTIDDPVNAGLKSIFLEPAHTELGMEKSGNNTRVKIDRDDVDIADTILTLKFQ
jgi:hypothetical protein